MLLHPANASTNATAQNRCARACMIYVQRRESRRFAQKTGRQTSIAAFARRGDACCCTRLPITFVLPNSPGAAVLLQIFDRLSQFDTSNSLLAAQCSAPPGICAWICCCETAHGRPKFQSRRHCFGHRRSYHCRACGVHTRCGRSHNQPRPVAKLYRHDHRCHAADSSNVVFKSGWNLNEGQTFLPPQSPETQAASSTLRSLTQRRPKLGEMSRALKIAPASSA